MSVSETFEPVSITHQPLLISPNITVANGWIFQERNITVSYQGKLGNYPNIVGFSWENPMVSGSPILGVSPSEAACCNVGQVKSPTGSC